MAHLPKVGGGFQIQYYLNHRKRTCQFPKNTPEAVLNAEFKRLEADLALHKAGIKRFGENLDAIKFITLGELTEQVLKAKEHDVAKETIARNRYAMPLFMKALGKHMLVADLKPKHFDQFKHAYFEQVRRYYERRGWKWDEDRVKRAYNKELENVRAVLRAGVDKGIIPADFLPKIEKLKLESGANIREVPSAARPLIH